MWLPKAGKRACPYNTVGLGPPTSMVGQPSATASACAGVTAFLRKEESGRMEPHYNS